MGYCCYMGKEAYDSKNYAEAVKWYTKAAEQGHAEAQYSLGIYHELSLDYNKYLPEALKWYRKAAEQGHAKAKQRLKKLGK